MGTHPSDSADPTVGQRVHARRGPMVGASGPAVPTPRTAVQDPQQDLDDEIERHRERHREGDHLRQRFREWSDGAHGTAIKWHIARDSYCERLAQRRADVYRQAAALLDTQPAADAAAEMMMRAGLAAVRGAPPLIGFDVAGLSYVAARAWQHCAWAIDPTLPVVQPKWD